MYYSYDKAISFGALLNFIIGERGVGKSYGAKKWVVKHFKKALLVIEFLLILVR